MPETPPIRFELDGEGVEVRVDPLRSLSAVIRDDLARSAVVEPCGVGACGACTVLLDGTTVLACLTPVGLVDGRSVTTIHGLPPDDPVVGAFVEATAFQCATCTPGFVLATKALSTQALDEDDPPDREAIIAALAGNLCRCSSYAGIVRAAEAATRP